MKKLILFVCVLFFPVQAVTANLDAHLMVISDLHYSQASDSIHESLLPMIDLTNLKHPGVTNWLGCGDIIDVNIGEAGPFSANIADLKSAFDSKGITFKTIAGNHDGAGAIVGSIAGISALYAAEEGLYPGQNWSWDIGNKWRVLTLEAQTFPGFSASGSELSWLDAQLTQAEVDGRFVIIDCHYQLYLDPPIYTAALTNSGITGTVTVTSSDPGVFITGGVINQILYLRHGTCSGGDVSCWGKMQVTQCDGGDVCTTGTSVTGVVKDDFASTGPADTWGFFDQQRMATNSSEIRAVLEAHGNSVVKLVLNGHTHLPGTDTINGIEYRGIQSSRYLGIGTVKTGGLLSLYDNGAWNMRGSGEQVSYNWHDYFVNGNTGSDTLNGGTSQYDPWSTMAKIMSVAIPGDSVHLDGTIIGTVDFVGESGNPILTSGVSTAKVHNISGAYLNISGVKITAGSELSMDNSTIKQSGSSL